MATSSRDQAPFPQSCALNTENLGISSADAHYKPSQPDEDAEHLAHLPGDPAVMLLPDEVYNHLAHELETPLLDELYDKLWLVAKRSGFHIDALHTQKVKGRSIVPTEDPRLHLVWHRDRIYVKPVPIYLLNHDFWRMFLPQSTPEHSESCRVCFESASIFDRSVAIGFLRSYALLVRSPLDFAIAKESYLTPDYVGWLQWSRFIKYFLRIGSDSVAKRYHYGQLRLSRLNWAVRIFQPQNASTMWFYEVSHWSTSEFVTRSTFPLVFVFASISLALSSMQVALSVPVDGLLSDGYDGYRMRAMNRAFWLFSIAVVLLWVIVWILLLGIPFAILCWQILWGFRNREKKLPVHASA